MSLASVVEIEESQFLSGEFEIVGFVDWKKALTLFDRPVSPESFVENAVFQEKERGFVVVPVFYEDDTLYVPSVLGHERPKQRFRTYLGVDTLDQRVAQFRRFQEDFALMTQPHITVPKSIEVMEYEGQQRAYGLVQWMEGETLYRKIRQVNQDDRTVHSLIKKVAASVFQLLTVSDMINQDLHSENIMIDDDNATQIDVSSLVEPFEKPEGTWFNERLTYFHWAPEVCNGGKVGQASTIYSFGYLCKQALGANRRFGKEEHSLWHEHSEFIQACLDRHIENRPDVYELATYFGVVETLYPTVARNDDA